MNTIKERLAALRSLMAQKGLSAYYISTADSHLSEYVCDHFKTRAWLSGFTGSAGTLVVLPDAAGLWTDGRYFIQAEEQLAGSGITLFKDGLTETQTIEDYLLSNLKEGDLVGFDGRTISASAGLALQKSLVKASIEVKADCDLVQEIWQDRPSLPTSPVWVYEEAFAGQPMKEKIKAVRKKLADTDSQVHVVSMLDEIAWLFNLRGSDIDYNPVFLAFVVISAEKINLFIDSQKLPDSIKIYLAKEQVTICDYNEVYSYLGALPKDTSVLVSPQNINYLLYQSLQKAGCKIVEGDNPIRTLKAIKNSTEISCTRNAHIKDGLVMVRFMKWLKEQISQEDCNLSEASAAAYLDQLRRDTTGCIDLSFPTISGYASHGAIVHYAVTEETDAKLLPRGLFLVDSGGHYMEGTTDITRTFALGPLTEDEKKHFALVLRSMLNLANAVFARGVSCQHLDILARMPFWEQGLDFLHGTGHGVGHLLNVHEGPNNFYWKPRKGTSMLPLQPGMITTDEPGIYIAESHGIRLENELLCIEKESTDYGNFLGFEVLTLAPIDLDAIDPELLTDVDKQRLNAYHKRVYEILAPELSEDERQWLAKYTREI